MTYSYCIFLFFLFLGLYKFYKHVITFYLAKVCKTNDYHVILNMLKTNFYDIGYIDDNGRTLLMNVCLDTSFCDTEYLNIKKKCIYYLLDNYGMKCKLCQIDKYGENIMHIAYNNGCMYLCDILIDKYFDYIDVTYKNNMDLSYFKLSLPNNSLEKNIKLLSQYTINEINDRNILLLLAKKAKEDELLYLIKTHKNNLIVDKKDSNDDSIFMWACYNKMEKVPLELLNIYGLKCKLNLINKFGYSALMYCVETGKDNVIFELLSKYKTECLYKYNKNINLISKIIDKKCMKSASIIFDVYSEQYFKNIAFDLLSLNNIYNNEFKEIKDRIINIVKNSNNPNILKNTVAGNLLSKLAYKKNEPALKQFIDLGLDLFDKDISGRTMLWHIIDNNLLETVKYVKDKLKFINICNLNIKSGEMFNFILNELPDNKKLSFLVKHKKYDIIKSLINIDNYKKSLNYIEQYSKKKEKLMKGICIDNSCLLCCDDTTDSYHNSCNHILYICSNCIENYKNHKMCAVCRYELQLTKCYIISS